MQPHGAFYMPKNARRVFLMRLSFVASYRQVKKCSAFNVFEHFRDATKMMGK